MIDVDTSVSATAELPITRLLPRFPAVSDRRALWRFITRSLNLKCEFSATRLCSYSPVWVTRVQSASAFSGRIARALRCATDDHVTGEAPRAQSNRLVASVGPI